MNTIRFEIPIVPTAQRRVRHTSRGGFSRTYKDKKQVVAEQDIIAFVQQHAPKTPLEGPIELRVTMTFPVTQTDLKSKKIMSGIISGAIQHTKKPDIDNCLKNLMDCMTKTGFWRDDTQVVSINAIKRYSTSEKFRPGWEVEIIEWAKQNGGDDV